MIQWFSILQFPQHHWPHPREDALIDSTSGVLAPQSRPPANAVGSLRVQRASRVCRTKQERRS